MKEFHLSDDEVKLLSKAIDWVYQGNIDKCISPNKPELEIILFKEMCKRLSEAASLGNTTYQKKYAEYFHDIMFAYGKENNCVNQIQEILRKVHNEIE